MTPCDKYCEEHYQERITIVRFSIESRFLVFGQYPMPYIGEAETAEFFRYTEYRHEQKARKFSHQKSATEDYQGAYRDIQGTAHEFLAECGRQHQVGDTSLFCSHRFQNERGEIVHVDIQANVYDACYVATEPFVEVSFRRMIHAVHHEDENQAEDDVAGQYPVKVRLPVLYQVALDD